MFIKNLNAAAEFRDNYGVQVIDTKEDFAQLETSLTDLDTAMWAEYHLVSSIFRRPVSKIFGTGHGGLGTGETDEDYDIAMLETLQSGNLEDIAYAHYERLMMSEFSKEMDLDIVWNPLKIMSDKDLADVNFIKSQTAMNEYNMGAISDFDERSRLSKEKGSGYSGVEVLEQVAIPDEDDEEDKAAMDGYSFNEDECLSQMTTEAYDEEYQGENVTLNKPFSDKSAGKKYAVYVKNEKGSVVKVRFGDPDMEIRRDNEEARKNFRARHDCENKNDKTKAGYWSCKFWSTKSVTELLS
jgi:hypothetical protein